MFDVTRAALGAANIVAAAVEPGFRAHVPGHALMARHALGPLGHGREGKMAGRTARLEPGMDA